jgi:hypothetical protein
MSEQEFKEALIDMLEQFGGNYSLSAVEDACALLNHPRTTTFEKNDCCYCREVVYSKYEVKRRRKIKSNFIDRTNVK